MIRLTGQPRGMITMAHQHAYERIRDDLRELILSGQLKPGDQLPTMSQLREQYEVSDMPVREALMHLRIEGLTVTRHGAGVYVRDRGADPDVKRSDD